MANTPQPMKIPDSVKNKENHTPTYGGIGIPSQEEVKDGVTIRGSYENDGNTWVLEKVDKDGNTVTKYEQNSLELQNKLQNKLQSSDSEDPNNSVIENKKMKQFSGTSLSVKGLMQSLASTLSAVNNKFNNGKSVYTNYLLFKVNGNTIVDTTSKNWNTNNMISFTNEISGSGQANKFTLEIAFIPNDRSINDVLTIEKMLMDATTIVDENGNLKSNASSKESLMLNCTFQYGYGDCDIRSPMYTGFILKYVPTLQDGWLKYTITGVAGLYNVKEIKLSPKQEYLANGGKQNPLIFLENIFKTEFKTLKYDFVVMENVGSVRCKDDYTEFQQKSIFDILTDICNALMSEEEYNKTESSMKFVPSQKQVYSYYVVSSSNGNKNGTVYLYKLPSLSKTSNDAASALTPDCEMSFNWFAPSQTGANFLVKSWRPEIDGTIVMNLMLNYLTTGDIFDTMDQDGNIVKVVSMGATRLGIDLEDKRGEYGTPTVNSMQEYAKWSYATQYSYNATLITQGLPCEVPMTGKIRVNAKMGNFTTSHQSSGVYAIIGKKDVINSSGFISEFKLFKIVKSYDPNLVSYREFSFGGKSVIGVYNEDGKLTGVKIPESNDGVTEVKEQTSNISPSANEAANAEELGLTGVNYEVDENDNIVDIYPNYQDYDTFSKGYIGYNDRDDVNIRPSYKDHNNWNISEKYNKKNID